jgi:hypothetical protein
LNIANETDEFMGEGRATATAVIVRRGFGPAAAIAVLLYRAPRPFAIRDPGILKTGNSTPVAGSVRALRSEGTSPTREISD